MDYYFPLSIFLYLCLLNSHYNKKQMIVCIAEKPSVARDIADILGARERKEGYIEGNGYQVTWTFGHLCTLKESRMEIMEFGQSAYESSSFWHQTDREPYLLKAIPYY